MTNEDDVVAGGGDADTQEESNKRRRSRRSSLESKPAEKKKEVKKPPSKKPKAEPKEEPADDSDSDNEPIAKKKKAAPKKKAKEEPKEEEEDSSDDDAPIKKAPKKAAAKKKTPEAAAKKKTPVKKKPVPKKKTPAKKASTKKRAAEDSDDSDDEPITKKKSSSKASVKKEAPKKRAKKEVKPEEPIFKWWEEEDLPDKQKWRTLEHKGPLFPPEYLPLPKNIKLKYDGKAMELSNDAEEVAGFYAAMLHSDYCTKEMFNKNFLFCWQKKMTKEERQTITNFKKCDFTVMQAHFSAQSELRKSASKEDKKARKEAEDKIKEEYGYADLDGRKQKVGNFRLEPPGLFRGRGDHPKMGMLKYRLRPEDVIINVGDLNKAPTPPPGHKWKEVRRDTTVTWMAAWNENIQNQNKYIMFNPESYIKAKNDLKKYEIARQLKTQIVKIREDYVIELKAKVMSDRQRATALYFIDKLALRAGGEKDTEEEADTVGCCNLRVEHVFAEDDCMVRFDFLGKDSIRYENTVKVSPQVHKNVTIFQRDKAPTDALFDRLNVPILNKYLQSLMTGLTAKVFRTYNASITLQEELKATPVDGDVAEKNLAYQRANRRVAVLCNHQRAAPKGFEGQVEKMDEVMSNYEKQIKDMKKELKQCKSGKDDKKKMEQIKKKIETTQGRLKLKKIAKVDKEENKTIALGTSKLNYLDPRITVAWTMNHDVPLEKVYNGAQRAKFRWAVEMTEKDFVF